MATFLVVSTLLQLFDLYLDLRQMRTYKIDSLPSEFTEGYELSDKIDRKLKKGKYEPKPDQPDETPSNELLAISSSEVKGVGESLLPESGLDKIKADFKKGQLYNTEHIKIVMVYKFVRVLFWIGFWVGLVQERLWYANVELIFPDYSNKGCPSYMNAFWADVCLGFIFELELTILHTAFFAAILYVDFFSIKKRYGFLKMNRCQFFLYFVVKNPLFELVRTCLLTLICLAVFTYGLQLNLALFLVIEVVVVTVVVVADVVFSTRFGASLRGKMTPLEQKDPELLSLIKDEWAKRSGGRQQPKCFVTKG